MGAAKIIDKRLTQGGEGMNDVFLWGPDDLPGLDELGVKPTPKIPAEPKARNRRSSPAASTPRDSQSPSSQHPPSTAGLGLDLDLTDEADEVLNTSPDDFPDLPSTTPPPATRPDVLSAYPPSLAHDVARCVSDEEVDVVRIAHGLTEGEITTILARADFRKEYADWQKQLAASGGGFKLKLRAMAEEFLPKLHAIMDSDLTAPSVRVDAFKYITKCAELEPTKAELEGSKGQGGTKIIIEIKNFEAGGSTAIDITPAAPSLTGCTDD